MIAALGALVVSMAVAALLVPLVRTVALRVGAVDAPGGRRVHTRSIPRMGGVAVVAGFFVPLVGLAFVESEAARLFYEQPARMVGLTLGGLIVSGLGALDDVRGVRAWHKLGVQIVAALVAWACGFRMESLSLPWLGVLDLGVFGIACTVLWITAVINALNLIDGLDGLAAGIAFFACLTNFVVATLNGNPLVMLIAAALGGALLGFLLYNFNPASIFMGDSGSMFLGYILATTALMGSSIQGSTTVAILVPLVSLGVPIMDTLFAMLRRVVERRPIFSPDRGHIHHRLLDLGITHRRAVLILYAITILFTAVAITIALGRNWEVGVALLVLTVALTGLVRFVGYFEYVQLRTRQKRHIHSRSTERLRATLPRALRELDEAETWGAVEACLERFGARAELIRIECVLRDGATLVYGREFRWEGDRASIPVGGREEVHGAFDVASACFSLKFDWLSDDGQVSPQADILLQLVADGVERHVRRFGPVEVAASATDPISVESRISTSF